MTERPVDKTALSYWFPLIKAAGLPVPKTVLLDMPISAQQCIWASFDDNDGTTEETAILRAFIADLSAAVRSMGLPAFLRTDHTSGKHDWINTCYVTSDRPDDIAKHISAIVMYSECACGMGVPWDRWVVREYLPIKPLGTCPRYSDMPLCLEYRFFIRDNDIVCVHPYWPKEALMQGRADLSLYEPLSAAPPLSAFSLARKAAKAINGAWSVDVLKTECGWYVTDMAEAHKSFHWEGCEHDFSPQ